MTGTRTLTIKEDILGVNRQRADANRKLLQTRHTHMINIMSSSGSGKTSLIASTIERFGASCPMAVIEGNIGASMDAAKIGRCNVPAIPVNTAGGCHLDAAMIARALDTLDLDRIDLILIENISNLVCTADFDLGANCNVVMISVPEGDDKACKYPGLFSEADIVLVTKIDVLPHFDFKLDKFADSVRNLNPAAKVLPLSVKTGKGMQSWFSWIEETLR